MKIKRVARNNRKKCFEVTISRGVFVLPYARVDPRPTSADRVRQVYVDDELGREGFTYVLYSGKEGSVHVDHVLDYNRDPEYRVDLLLYELTLVLQDRLKASGISVREIGRRLGTSPAQLYRLLDQTNTRKSFRQMLELLHVLGCDVEIVVKGRR